MSPQLHDGPREDGRSCPSLRVVDDPERIENLRQMLSSFNHRCRNSLNGIKMSLYLFKREVDGPIPRCCSELERSYQEIEELFNRLQTIYRPLVLTFVRSPVGPLLDQNLPTWRSWFSRRGRTLELARPAVDAAGDFDPMQLTQGLNALIAWRADSGPATWNAVLSWSMVDGFFEIRWEEGRPRNGCSGADAEMGQSDQSRPNGPTESLAYPLLKRIVIAHGGSVETSDHPTFVVKLKWPQFQSMRGADNGCPISSA